MGEDNDEQRPGFDYWASHKGQGQYFDTAFNVDGRRQVPGYYTTSSPTLATDWLKRHDRPWMLVVGQKAPHGGRFSRSQLRARLRRRHDSKPANHENYRARASPPGLEGASRPGTATRAAVRRERVDTFVRAYLATLLSVDDSVGQIYEALRAAGQLDNTVFVFTSDNGFLLGEHGRVDKRTMYEESIRIPMLVRYPRLIRGRHRRVTMVLNHDLAPSLLDMAGPPHWPT